MNGRSVQALVIGSGAGGAVTASVLASGGLDVLVVEEGSRHPPSSYGEHAPAAMQRLYRRRGMTPILGKVPVGFVEGCCLGGSTEINSGFWHRTPREILLRWKARYELDGALPEQLVEHFEWAEKQLCVQPYGRPWPPSTAAFARGVEAMGWSGAEVPRTAERCRGANVCASGCPTGAKHTMSATLLPSAEVAGARILTRCRVRMLIRERRRVSGVLATLTRDDGSQELIRIDAENVFVCAGATETPALLRRSGIRYHVGDSFRIHPMLKVAAHFDEQMDAHRSVLPLIQVKEFWPDISLGGAFFTPGHLAMLLSDNWRENRVLMPELARMASYYVAVRGTGRGTVRPSLLDDGAPVVRYQLSREDLLNLGRGLARLATILLAGGARAVYPGVHGVPVIKSEIDAIRWLDQALPASSLSLTTVHAFCGCPIGERRELCAASSYGQVHEHDNLYVNDASMLPDSPGVNPQGTIMALARRNAHHFLQTREGLS